MIDWNKMVDASSESGYQYVAVYVKKTDAAGYMYDISYISANGGYGGFLYGDSKTNTVPVWVPSCWGGCDFPDSFAKKYPEVVKEFNAQEQ